jgi:hypothetical protein
MKKEIIFGVLAVLFTLSFKTAAHAATLDSTQALQVLAAIDAATDFKNSDPQAKGVSGDPRYLHNEFSMLLRGALGGDVVGWGRIQIAEASCLQSKVSLNCLAVISYQDGNASNRYAFSVPSDQSGWQSISVTVTSVGGKSQANEATGTECKDGERKQQKIDPAPCTCLNGNWLCPR